jgi:hypothetical protein
MSHHEEDEHERARLEYLETMKRAHPDMSDLYEQWESRRTAFFTKAAALRTASYRLEGDAEGDVGRVVYDALHVSGSGARAFLTIDAELADEADVKLLDAIARGLGFKDGTDLNAHAAGGDERAANAARLYRVFLGGLACTYVACALPSRFAELLDELRHEAALAVGNFFSDELMSKPERARRPSDQVTNVRRRHAKSLRKRLAAFAPPPGPPDAAPGGELDRGLDSLLTAHLSKNPRRSDAWLMKRVSRPTIQKAAGLSEGEMRKAIGGTGMAFPAWRKLYFPLVVARVRKRLSEIEKILRPVSPK